MICSICKNKASVERHGDEHGVGRWVILCRDCNCHAIISPSLEEAVDNWEKVHGKETNYQAEIDRAV